LTPAQAVFATSPYPLGGISTALCLGTAIDRFGPERALSCHYVIGTGFIALIAFASMPYVLLLAVIFLAGLTIIGSQNGAVGTCGKLYPARMRTSGTKLLPGRPVLWAQNQLGLDLGQCC